MCQYMRINQILNNTTLKYSLSVYSYLLCVKLLIVCDALEGVWTVVVVVLRYHRMAAYHCCGRHTDKASRYTNNLSMKMFKKKKLESLFLCSQIHDGTIITFKFHPAAN